MENNIYKLSIIIPIYNAEKYLRRCIESFIYQIDKNIEVVLVNDGSVDNSEIICREYEKDYPNVYVISQDNRGVSCARNEGILNSHGEWIMFVDSDDQLNKNFYTIISKYWHSDKDMLMFDTNVLDDDKYSVDYSQTVNTMEFGKNDMDLFITNNFLSKFRAFGGFVSFRSACSKLIRRSIIVENKVFFDNGVKIGEDMLFMLKMYNYISSVLYVLFPLYETYSHNGSSVTNRYKPELEEIINSYISAIQPWLEKNKKYDCYHGYYRLNDIILYLKYDFFHNKNTEKINEKRKRMRLIFNNYMSYYRLAKQNKLIQNYNLKKRIVIFLALHNYYLPLKIIYKFKYR